MLRRLVRKPEAHENHERWLVSYADFITLMFAFFVVMYATSQADKDRARRLSEAVDNAFSNGSRPTKLGKYLQGGHSGPTDTQDLKDHTPDNLQSSYSELQSALRAEIDSGRLEVRMEKRGVVISLREATFFPPGEASVSPSGFEAIAKLAPTLKRIPNAIRLEGHTDAVPIANERFPSNWHLSAARSIAMLRLLASRHGIPENRLAAVGYADTVPIDSNETEAGRTRNRRVDITILNEASYSREAAAALAPAANRSGNAR
jgi:chemotaxis protein MotB